MELLNTLFVTMLDAYLHLDHDTVRVEVGKETQLRVPLMHLGGIVCFGDILVSPRLIHRCAEDGRSVVLLDRNGRFRARIEGPVSGNVLLRRAQHLALTDEGRCAAIARNCVAAKIQNSRQVVLRSAREAENPADGELLGRAASMMASVLPSLKDTADLDEIRGCEGQVANVYFNVLSNMVLVDRDAFAIEGRVRRPPTDPTNALLSFLYALLLSDCVSALEGVGLDPQVGFLHSLRPGRPSLGLDLMEELRPVMVDRLALTLINRRQLTRDSFVERPGGSIHIEDKARKEVIVAYQKRKQEEITHRVIGKKMPLGLVPHVQARLLARHLRGDVEEYLAFLYR